MTESTAGRQQLLPKTMKLLDDEFSPRGLGSGGLCCPAVKRDEENEGKGEVKEGASLNGTQLYLKPLQVGEKHHLTNKVILRRLERVGGFLL